MTSHSSTSRKLIPASQPISLLSTNEANIYTHIHPILLLTLYYIRFPSLVASPVPTLLSSLVPLSILQVTYTVLCLPPTSNGSKSGSTHAKKTKSKRGPNIKSHADIGAKIIVSMPFAICYENLAKSCSNLLAFNSFLNPDHHTRCPGPYRNYGIVWCTSDHPYVTYCALRGAHCIAICSTFVLRVWGRRKDMERDHKRELTV